jgi:hypothetical protein
MGTMGSRDGYTLGQYASRGKMAAWTWQMIPKDERPRLREYIEGFALLAALYILYWLGTAVEAAYFSGK